MLCIVGIGERIRVGGGDGGVGDGDGCVGDGDGGAGDGDGDARVREREDDVSAMDIGGDGGAWMGEGGRDGGAWTGEVGGVNTSFRTAKSLF